MRFMNEYDIDRAVQTWQDHPVLGPASKTLASLRDAANANSDGWVYWPKPARAAAKLMELIERDGTFKYMQGDRDDVTEAEFKAALRPIKAFRTRSGIAFEIFEMTRDGCPGSGRSWGSGTGSPICPVCHRGPGSMGVKRPIRRKGRWTGRVPDHSPLWQQGKKEHRNG